MDVTAMLNTASAAAAVEPKLEMIHERKDSSEEEFTDSVQTPSATTADSTAPSSMVATPLEKTPSRRSSESRAPSRNRRPWDAGGYSLSMALDNTKKLIQTSPNSRHALPSSLSLSSSTATPTSVSAALPENMDLSSSTTMPGSTSPRHKFSDSRSSFSSAYTNASNVSASSTNNSVAHSRISSLSTVSENQPLSNLIADFSLLETRISEPCIGGLPANLAQGSGPGYHQQHQLKLQQYSFKGMQASPSQDGGIDSDRLNFQPESPTPVRSRHDMSMGASPEPSPRSPGRAQSPSDAMLIQRPGQPGETEYFPSPSRLQIPPIHHRSQSRGDFLQPSGSPTHRHKRAVSAPDFPSITNSSFNPRFPTFGPIPEPTPSPSQHSDGNLMENESSTSSPTGPEQSHDTSGATNSGIMVGSLSASPMNVSAPGLAPLNPNHQSHYSTGSISDHTPNTQAEAAPEDAPLTFETACLYRGDCQTGSQLRKAISHIFGRNKLCTRMIPTGVWVHYCRKHYQRTRYRNGNEYPQRQISLVREQITRVQRWSDQNVKLGSGPVLKDWSLSVRKREQLRLDSKNNGKKRPYHEDGMEDEDLGENYDDDRAEMSGTAVPDWLVPQIGDGFSTELILGLVDRLRLDIEGGRLQQIPDIEILPNIVTDATSNEPASNSTAKKTYTKRRTASTTGFGAGGNGHRRSQSVNTSALRRADSIAMARRSSQPNNYMGSSSGRPFGSDYLQAPMEKRQRVDGDGMGGVGQHGHSYQHHQHHHSMGSMSDHRYEQLRPGFNGRQLAHRPAFAGIRESQAEGLSGYYPQEELTHQHHAHQQQQYGGGSNGFYAHQRSMTEATPTQNGYASDPRYATHDFEARREHERHHSTPGTSAPADSPYGVLPAPNPQRLGNTPVAQQLEASTYMMGSSTSSAASTAATRRPNMHQRSQSEAGFMHHSSNHYGRPTSSGRIPLPNGPVSNSSNNAGGRYLEPEQHQSTGYAYSTHQSNAHYGHGHSHSMSHGPTHGHQHTHSYKGSQQEHGGSQYSSFGQTAANSQYPKEELRGSSGPSAQQYHAQQQQTSAPTAPIVAAPNQTQAYDKFESVQLPPIFGYPSPEKHAVTAQRTPTIGSDAAPTGSPSGPTEGASDRHLQPPSSDYLGHSRHQSSPAVSVSSVPQPQDAC